MFNSTHVRVSSSLARKLQRCAHALTASLLVYCGLALTPPGASAGRYHVYTCRTPNGTPAPTDGWTSTTTPPSATVIATNTCATGGALTAALGDGVKHEVGASAKWELALPQGAALTEATLWRSGDVKGGAAQNATYDFTIAGPTMPEVFSECMYISKCTGETGESKAPLSSFNLLPVPTANLGANLYVTAGCGGLSGYMCPEGVNDPAGYAAAIYLYAADLILEQAAQPIVTPGSVGGELATGTKLSGTASVTFEASDSGSGVYQAIVEVDEKVVGSTMLDSNGGRCADVGETTDGLPAFLYVQPCAPLVSADVPLDTTSLSNGVHHVVVSVADAAGNRTVVVDRSVEVANAAAATTSLSSGSVAQPVAAVTVQGGGISAGPPNGSPSTSQVVLSAHWRASAKAAIVGRWGRAQAIVGRLTSAAGTPISGAAVEVNATPASQGARASVGDVRTASDGSFSVRIPARSSSERIAISYRAHAGDPLPAAVSTLVLRVPASLSLRVAPRVSHVGGKIVFSGLLRGGHIPSGGKQIVLQAHAPGGGWRTFRVLSTDRRGRYRASYRFRLAGPVMYRFRALSRQEADFPFSSGSSNAVTVLER